LIPSRLLTGVDIIYVGQFEFLNSREINALYDSGAVYITNVQEDEQDVIDDIIHEVSHSLEEKYKDFIYSDGLLMKEFIGKRKRLYYILKSRDLKPPEDLQIKVDYDKDIDEYLYKQVGYNTLWNVVVGLFMSPYSVTDLREYFAVGFEHYVQNDKDSVKQISPLLYKKLEDLFNLEE